MELTAFNSMHAISREQNKLSKSKGRRSSVEVLCDARRDIMQLKESQAELENELLNIRQKETDNILEGVQDHDVEVALHELEEEASAAAEADAQHARALSMVTARAVKRAAQSGYVGTGKHKAKIDVEARVDTHNTATRSAKSCTASTLLTSKPSDGMLDFADSCELMPGVRRGSMLAMLNQAEALSLQMAASGGSDSPPCLSPTRLQHGKHAGPSYGHHTGIGGKVSGGSSASGLPPNTSYLLEPLSPKPSDKAYSFSSPLPSALSVPRGGHHHSRARHLGSAELLDEAAMVACQLAKPATSLTTAPSSLLSGHSSLLHPTQGAGVIRNALSSLIVPSNMLQSNKAASDHLHDDLSRAASADMTLLGSMAESRSAPKAGRRAGKAL